MTLAAFTAAAAVAALGTAYLKDRGSSPESRKQPPASSTKPSELSPRRTAQTPSQPNTDNPEACGELTPDEFGEALGNATSWRERVRRELQTVLDTATEGRQPTPQEIPGPDEQTIIKVGTDLADRVDLLARFTCRRIIKAFFSDILRTEHHEGEILCAGNAGKIACLVGPMVIGGTPEERLMHASCLEWVRGQIAGELKTLRPRLACTSEFVSSTEETAGKRGYVHRVTCHAPQPATPQQPPSPRPPSKRQPVPRTKHLKPAALPYERRHFAV